MVESLHGVLQLLQSFNDVGRHTVRGSAGEGFEGGTHQIRHIPCSEASAEIFELLKLIFGDAEVDQPVSISEIGQL